MLTLKYAKKFDSIDDTHHYLPQNYVQLFV